jgi:hypothetical protein
MDTVKDVKEDRPLMTALLVAIGLGIIVTLVFLYIGVDSYSAIYIAPNSITQDSTEKTVFFTYGVKCLEQGGADYSLEFYSGDTLITSKQFKLRKGETLEERTKLDLPGDTKAPVKISLVLNNSKKTDEVHFWVK